MLKLYTNVLTSWCLRHVFLDYTKLKELWEIKQEPRSRDDFETNIDSCDSSLLSRL